MICHCTQVFFNNIMNRFYGISLKQKKTRFFIFNRQFFYKIFKIFKHVVIVPIIKSTYFFKW